VKNFSRPTLQAMVLAESVHVDHATGRLWIAGPFDVMRYDEAAAKAGAPFTMGYVYLALTGIRGPTSICLRLVRIDGPADETAIAEFPRDVICADPLTTLRMTRKLDPLPPIKPGDYSIDLLHEGEILGSARVRVLQNERQGSSVMPSWR